MDKIQNVAEQGLGLVDRSRRLRAVILVSLVAWMTAFVLIVIQTSTASDEPIEPPEPITVVTDNCRSVTDAAVDAIGAFTDFLDAMNDNNALLATIAQRAAARGLVNQSDTDRLRDTNDTIELLNRELVYVLGTFEKEAARCYAAR